VFAPLPFLSFVIYKVSDLINKRSTVVQQELSKLTSHAQETFSAIRVIKAYAREKHYINELATLNTDFKKHNLRLAISRSVFSASFGVDDRRECDCYGLVWRTFSHQQNH
jgi:ATP-binding cassette subfamily B multidrug efflux pump